MAGFKLFTPENEEIKFLYYNEQAPQTCAAFNRLLPFSRKFAHARMSGSEIWADNFVSEMDHQENASIFVESGEVVLGAIRPTRAKTSSTFGIYYGEGKGIDACNIFAHVSEIDKEKLHRLGTKIWIEGIHELRFEKWDD